MTEQELQNNPKRKAYLKDLQARKPGITTNKMKGVKAKDVVPYRSDNIKLSKAEFVIRRKVDDRVNAKMKIAQAEIRKEAELSVAKETELERAKVIKEMASDRGEPKETVDEGGSLETKTVAQLKEIAKVENVDISGLTKKDEIIDAIMANED